MFSRLHGVDTERGAHLLGELFSLAIVLAAALAGGRLANRLGYPAILGELIAGMVIGPPALGWIDNNELLAVLGEVGVLLMMLYIGMHLDLSDLRRASLPGLMAAIGGFIVPAGLGFLLMYGTGHTVLEALFVGLAMGSRRWRRSPGSSSTCASSTPGWPTSSWRRPSSPTSPSSSCSPP